MFRTGVAVLFAFSTVVDGVEIGKVCADRMVGVGVGGCSVVVPMKRG